MRSYDPLKADEAKAAGWESAKGAGVGAAQWGAVAGALAVIGHVWSPVYRGFTIQFKIFLQMSGMILGGMIEADHRLRLHQQRMHRQRRMQTKLDSWERYQEEFAQTNSKGDENNNNNNNNSGDGT